MLKSLQHNKNIRFCIGDPNLKFSHVNATPCDLSYEHTVNAFST